MTTRITFELHFQAGDVFHAKNKAIKHFSDFLSIPEEDIEDKVSLELKIDLHKFEAEDDINLDLFYDITAHGQVKNGFIFTPIS
jgi:hypothetical protein